MQNYGSVYSLPANMTCESSQTAEQVSYSTEDTHESALCNDRPQESRPFLLTFQCNSDIERKGLARCTRQCQLRDTAIHTECKSSWNRTISMQSSILSGKINCSPFITLYRSRLHSNLAQMSSRVFICIVIILSVLSSVSHAHKLPWTSSWSIDNTTLTTETAQEPYSLQLRIPELIAVTGHLFQYQIATDAFDTRTTFFQV